uniref:Uncharacterized protein n=1 Tax=Euplotes crassus TaxID=5936 RepID=A0A7S3KIL9_EUPCR|mmetsp:Transcript_26284/g.26200  ORF Transcript_26284/g.26200 Transcript_26284/m.26200 type:complete len:207 (+) Transcript_26284:16-636(+)
MEFDEFDYKYSLIMLGDSSVGKTTIATSFKTGSLMEKSTQSTVGIDFWTKVVNVNGVRIQTLIYDTSGQERFRSITKGYIKKGEGVLILYDITNKQSFKAVKLWINQIREYGQEHACILVVGNKSDLKESRKVTYEEGESLAESYGVHFMETSSKDMESIDQAFEVVIKQVYFTGKEREKNSKVTNRGSKTLRHEETKRKSDCICK